MLILLGVKWLNKAHKASFLTHSFLYWMLFAIVTFDNFLMALVFFSLEHKYSS